MPWDIQQDDERAQAHKAELDASAERQIGSGMTAEMASTEYDKQLAEYNAKSAPSKGSRRFLMK